MAGMANTLIMNGQQRFDIQGLVFENRAKGSVDNGY